MAAYALVAALVLAFVATHVQLWRVRRRLTKSPNGNLTPEQARHRRRKAMAVSWGFGAAAVAGALAADHGYYWVTPLVFGALILALARVAKVGSSPQLKQEVEVGRALLSAASTDPPPVEAGPEARISWLRNEWPKIEATAAKKGVDPQRLALLKREVFGGPEKDREPSIWDEPSGGWGFDSKPPGTTKPSA